MMFDTLYNTQLNKAYGTAESAACAFFVGHTKGSTLKCQDAEEKSVNMPKSLTTKEITICE